MAATATKRRINDLPIYWFAVLDRAIEDGDMRRAAQAQGELRRRGYDVNPRRQGTCR